MVIFIVSSVVMSFTTELGVIAAITNLNNVIFSYEIQKNNINIFPPTVNWFVGDGKGRSGKNVDPDFCVLGIPNGGAVTPITDGKPFFI